jgi:hypothetical protein
MAGAAVLPLIQAHCSTFAPLHNAGVKGSVSQRRRDHWITM